MKYFDDIRFVMGGDTLANEHTPVSGQWPDFYSIQFDRSNRVFYEVDGRRVAELDAPVVYLTRPESRYRFGCCDDSPWHHTFIGVTGPRAKRIFEGGFYHLSPTDMLSVHRPRECAEVFDSILEIYQSKALDRHHEAVIKLEQFLGLLARNQQMDAPELPFAEEMRDLADRILATPLEPWDFEACAAELCVSYSHFRRLFREHLNRAPHSFLLSARMRRAAETLERTSQSIKEVCHQCGYDDLAQFSKAFKHQIGLSPRQYRNSLRMK